MFLEMEERSRGSPKPGSTPSQATDPEAGVHNLSEKSRVRIRLRVRPTLSSPTWVRLLQGFISFHLDFVSRSSKLRLLL